MPFTKGMPRPPGAGRKRGSPTKLSKEVTSRLEEMGCDPVRILASIAMDEKCETGIRRLAASDLMKYTYRQLRSVEHTGAGGAAIAVDCTYRETLMDRIAGVAARIGTNGHPPAVQ
jgi:hypothetical protein